MKKEHELSRRRFASALASSSVVAGFHAGTTRVASANAGEAVLQAFPPLTGALHTDEATRRNYAQDYGQIVHERPRAALLPGSIDDVVTMVRHARRNGLRIAARGQGHQPFGQAQVSAGIVVDLRSLHDVRSFSDDQIDVEVGADWRAVLSATLSRARTPPVLTNYLGLTVGGTLSIGGIGVATLHHGAQVDQVRALQVVTGEGELLDCSARERPDLFQAVLAGQGQCAIITRAVLRVVPAPPMVREYVFHYADTAALLRDLRVIAQQERFDGAVALIVRAEHGWTYALQAVRHFTPPAVPDDAALAAGLHPTPGSVVARDVTYLEHADVEPKLGSAGAHADLGLLIPGSNATRFLEESLARLTADDLGAATALRVFFWNRALFTRALFRVPDAESCVYIAMLRAEASEPSSVARMLAGNRKLFERCRALGGTLYPFGALPLTPRDWQQHYSEAWRGLIDAKRRYDPGNVFASGPDLGAR